MFSSWLEYVWGSAESQDRDQEQPKMADDWVLVEKTAMDIDCDQEVNAAVESPPTPITKTAASPEPETQEFPKSPVQLQSKSESKRKKSMISIRNEVELPKPKTNSKQNVKRKLKNREITAENLPQRIMTRSQKFHYNKVANVSNDRKCGRQQTW